MIHYLLYTAPHDTKVQVMHDPQGKVLVSVDPDLLLDMAEKLIKDNLIGEAQVVQVVGFVKG